jgi:hypothetical protein
MADMERRFSISPEEVSCDAVRGAAGGPAAPYTDFHTWNYFTSNIFLTLLNEPLRSRAKYMPLGSDRASNRIV